MRPYSAVIAGETGATPMDLRPVQALRRIAVASAAALVVLGGGSQFPAPPIALASSVTYTVNTTADTSDADLAAAACRDVHGRCSLRAAVMQANYHPGADTIVVPKGTYKLTRVGQNDDIAIVGDLDITESVTIRGAGAASTIVDGNGAVTGDRVFQVLPTAAAVTISGLTIQHGRRTGVFDEGGGLKWDSSIGSLTLSHVTIQGNSAKYGGGAALSAGNGATLHLDHLLVSGNGATSAAGGLEITLGDTNFSLSASRITANHAYEGGGMYLQGTTTSTMTQAITTTEIDANKATLSGGIESHAGNATTELTITDSWIHGNSATGYGGGIGNYGEMAVTGTTISGNSAVTRAGGVYGYAGSLTHLTNDTLSGNTTPGSGGAVYLEKIVSSAAAMNAIDTTFAGNTASSGGVVAGDAGAAFATWNVLMAKGATGANCALAVTVVQPTFADDASCGLGGGDNAAVLLSPLGFHGGRTPTRVPLAGSAGIDGGAALLTPLVDQRGITRPQGAAHDAGAVEVCQTKPPAPVLSKPTNGAVTTLRRISLAWKTVPCVEGYKVVVRRTSSTGTIVQTVTLTQSTSLLTVTLARGYTYYWRVTAVGDRGSTNSVWRHVRVR
jgi:CSLREA domain-containing protein